MGMVKRGKVRKLMSKPEALWELITSQNEVQSERLPARGNPV
jgi:hypothetical protein